MPRGIASQNVPRAGAWGVVPRRAAIASARAGNGRSVDHRVKRRRDGAHARQATNDLRTRVSRLEREYEAAESDVAQLQEQLSDPDIYERPEDVHDLASRHSAAKARARALVTEWESAAQALENLG